MEGADVRELGLKAEKLRQRERLVRGSRHRRTRTHAHAAANPKHAVRVHTLTRFAPPAPLAPGGD
jgi:hypothetical protein